MTTSPTTASPAVSNPFFSFIDTSFKGLSEGLAVTGREVLPRFFSKQLLDQQEDPFRDPTFVQAFSAPTLDNGQSSTGETGPIQKSLFDFQFGGTKVTGGAVLLIGALAVGGFLLLRRFT